MNIKTLLNKLQEDSSIELFDRFKTKTLTNKGWVTTSNLSTEIARIIGDASPNKSDSLNISKRILQKATSSSQIEDLKKLDLYIDTKKLQSGIIVVRIYDENGNEVDSVTIQKTGKDQNIRWNVI